MKNIKYLLVAIFLVVLQGCSNNVEKISTEEANKIISSISSQDLQKVEINSSNNEIMLYVNKEFITKEDVDSILSNIRVGNISGLSAFDKDNFSNKISSVQLVSINKNKAIFKINSLNDIELNITTSKYSDNYVKSAIRELSQNIIRFNELAGRLEIDIKQYNLSDTRIDEFNNAYNELNNSISKVKTLTSENTNFSNLSKLQENIRVVEGNMDVIKQSVNSGVSAMNSNAINNSYLNINELDKIAREIVTL